MKRNPRSFITAPFPISMLIALAISLPLDIQAAGVHLQTFKTHSRISVPVDESVTTDWKETKNGFELTLKGIGLADLGIPLGEEETEKARIARLTDPRVASLKVTELSGAVKIEGKWKYPSGKAALANPEMETFEYRDKTPPQFVIDLWTKKGPTLAEAQASRKQKTQLAEIKKVEEQRDERAARRLASLRAKAEAEDTTRFCRQPLSEGRDVFLPFQPFHEPLQYARWFATNAPDAKFFYFEPTTKEQDAQYVRLALELYRQGKPALVLKTLDFFDAEHPRSTFRHEMKFLRANALIKLNFKDEAERMLASLMADAKDSPVAMHAAMYLAGKRANEKAHLAALEIFQWLANNHSGNRLNWLFHLGAAESLYGLKQTDRAAKEYQWVMEHAPDRKDRAEAAARLGDVYLDRQQYEQALASYFQGINYFGEEMASFPSIHLNRAETLYWLGQYDRAKSEFDGFLKRYAGHPEGWRATYRLGEIAGRGLGAKDVASTEAESREKFYETINRFPFSAGATLARLRLLPCGDHGGMNAEAADRFFSGEAATFDGKNAVVMDRYAVLRDLAEIRTNVSWGQGEKAIELAIRQSLSPKAAELRPELSDLVAVLFSKQVEKLLSQGKKLEAISFYQDKSSQLPKWNTAVIEPGYLLKLSQAAADLGLGKVAEDLAHAYRSKTGEGRDVASADLTDAERKLKISEQKFTEAKALWMSKGSSAEEEIRSLLADVQEESPFSYEREIILGLLDEAKGKKDRALGHAVRAQLLKPAVKGAVNNFRLENWLARLQAAAGDPKVALEMYRNVEAALRGGVGQSEDAAVVLGVPVLDKLEATMLAQAEICEKLSRWGEAAATYAHVVEAGKDGISSDRAMYGYGRALLKAGSRENREKGFEVLQRVAESKTPGSEFWKKLASETLANEKAKQKVAKEGNQ